MISQIIKLKKLRRIAAVLIAIVMLAVCCATSVSAADLQTTPNDSYSIWNGYSQKLTVSQRPMYEYAATISGASLGIGTLSEPNDVCTDKDGNFYIMDTNNGRIIVANPDFSLKRVITGLVFGGESIDITGSLGVFVRDNGSIYVADTQHKRIVVCSNEGVVTEILSLPEADVIPSNFQYMPKRIAIDSKGYVYVVSEGSYYGALLYGPSGEFMGFYGSNSVANTIGDIFKKAMNLLFQSNTKRAEAVKSLPFQFNDIAIDDEDFIYTSTGAVDVYSAKPGQLKKLSPGGINVLKNKTALAVTSSDSLQFSDASASVRSASSTNRVTDLSSITLDENGFLYSADNTYGRVYIYDQNCNPITVFGGGTGSAYQKGLSSSSISLALGQNGTVIICDRVNSQLQVYKRTDYGNLVMQAQNDTVVGAYSDAKPLWEQVLALDRNSQLAYRGLAKACLIDGDYDKALEYAKIGIDQDTYASAFEYVRANYLTKNFTWIFIVVILIAGAIVTLLVVSNKKEVKLIKNQQISLMFKCILHPFQGFSKIRYEGGGSVILATVILIIFYIATFLKDVYGGFMYQIFDKTAFNSFIVLLGTVGVAIVWVICNWGMSTLFEGKGKVKQIYICTCYSLIPIAVYNLIYTILSNVVVPDEELIITVIYYVCLAITVIMFCISVMTVHEFGFGKFIGITIISLIAMLVVVFIIFMIGILVQQFGSFFVTIYKEVKYR